ncbi:hypothetical protein WJX81_005421 [Elliptochloris bilobata]|uniref:U-box domain-containing protein n=1 Tax=Elliptochloris bilobata TaxID=381761 RepID=A0AAW1RFS6_9CHLO
MVRALLALAAGTWGVLKQRGFWVALAASFLFSRVYQPGALKVEAPCRAGPWVTGSASPAAVPYNVLQRDAAPRVQAPSRWWPHRRKATAAPDPPAASGAGAGAPGPPRSLWEFRRARPLFSDAVLSLALSAPRVATLWLYVYDPATITRLREAACALRAWRDAWLLRLFASEWTFWELAIFAPSLQVAGYASLFLRRHPLVAVWTMLVAGAHVTLEIYALAVVLHGLGAPAAETFSSLILSHVLTPLFNILLALAQVPLSHMLPSAAMRVLFWARVILLPLVSLYADWVAWLPAEPEDGEARGVRGPVRSDQRARRSREEAAAVHWPPPLAIPEWLEEEADGAAPDFFRCPITLGLMREPTQTPAGVTYEREAIVRWLANHRSDPSTKMALRRRHLAPNLALRSAIEGWVASEAVVRGRRSPAASLSCRGVFTVCH